MNHSTPSSSHHPIHPIYPIAQTHAHPHAHPHPHPHAHPHPPAGLPANRPSSLASDGFSQEYKEVEAHLASSLPDFFSSHASSPHNQSEDPLSRKRKLISLGPWDMSHLTSKRAPESPHSAPDNCQSFAPEPSRSIPTPAPNPIYSSSAAPVPNNLAYSTSVQNSQTAPDQSVHQHSSTEPVALNSSSQSDQVSSLLSAYLKNPINPAVNQAVAFSRLAPLAQVSAFGSNENVRQAVLTGLAHSSQSKQTPEWARGKPKSVEGPFLCLGGVKAEGDADKGLQQPMIYGPVDPNLLDPQTVIAVYYACYPYHAGSPPAFDFDLEVLDPVLGGTLLLHPPQASEQLLTTAAPLSTSTFVPASSLSHPHGSAPEPPGPAVHAKNAHTLKRNSVPSRSREQLTGGDGAETSTGVDPFKVPEVDMSGRKRAPRKCGVCGQYYCKGRGNRTLCPSFVAGRDEHVSPFGPTPPRPKLEEQRTANGDISVHTTAPTESQWLFTAGSGDNSTSPEGSSVNNPTVEGSGGVESVSSSGEKMRKRGPRRCAMCLLMNCPGNGNRKLCSRASSGSASNSTRPPPPPNASVPADHTTTPTKNHNKS